MWVYDTITQRRWSTVSYDLHISPYNKYIASSLSVANGENRRSLNYCEDFWSGSSALHANTLHGLTVNDRENILLFYVPNCAAVIKYDLLKHGWTSTALDYQVQTRQFISNLEKCHLIRQRSFVLEQSFQRLLSTLCRPHWLIHSGL